MAKALRFRIILPIVQFASAALFGGLGLWQRSLILGRPGFGDGQTLWDSTARFHIWPWPFKFAVITNTPAFLSWAAVSELIGDRWSDVPEVAFYAPSLLFVALLWYGVGRWFDRQWGALEQPGSNQSGRGSWPWVVLLFFTLICAAGASIHSTSAYLIWGATLWLVVGLGVATIAGRRKLFQSRG